MNINEEPEEDRGINAFDPQSSFILNVNGEYIDKGEIGFNSVKDTLDGLRMIGEEDEKEGMYEDVDPSDALQEVQEINTNEGDKEVGRKNTCDFRGRIPEVANEQKPNIGMTFGSVEEAFDFYNRYAWHAGFSVRSSSCSYGKDRMVKWKLWVCYKEGQRDERAALKRGQTKRRRVNVREGCMARMGIKIEKGGSHYNVVRFVEEHNHDLVIPCEKHLLPSHRRVSRAKNKLIVAIEEVNIGKEEKEGMYEDADPLNGLKEVKEIDTSEGDKGVGRKNACDVRGRIPEVADEQKPSVGMTFGSVEEAFEFYNRYAWHAGFSVRSSSCTYGKDRVVKWKLWVCYKQGQRDERAALKRGQTKRRRVNVREGCVARMGIKIEKGGSHYNVVRFVEEHNHDLVTPCEKHLLPSHRRVSRAKEKLKNACEEVNIFKEEEKKGMYEDVDPLDALQEVQEIDTSEGDKGVGRKKTCDVRGRCIPEVADEQKPNVGMTFGSIEEAFEFYNRYAWHAGFSVRSSSCSYGKDRIVKWKLWVCYKEGQWDERAAWKRGQTKRRRVNVREGCMARMGIKMEKGGSHYNVVKFVEEHSHGLASQREKHFLPSHRRLSKAKTNCKDEFGDVNIGTSKMMSMFKIQSGEYENIRCIETDARNYEREETEEAGEYNAQLLCEHFKEMTEMNPCFAHAVKVDDMNKITHCFWADPISRASSVYFGDVVVFDTTYITNCYGFIFAPFIGVNHHGQSITLACAFIHSETTDSFIWLFESWLKFMPGGAPRAIITHQDIAITKAIAQVFPHTLHRFCIWHIMRKVPQKIGPIQSRDLFRSEFCQMVRNSETCEEFECAWERIISKHRLQENSWFSELYEIRHKWAPPYLRHIFFAGMSSSQRAKTMNKFMKNFVLKRYSFMEFIEQFDKAIARQRHNELFEDHQTLSTIPQMKTPFDMEKKLANIYTRKYFYIFQEELFETQRCLAFLLNDNGQIRMFKVKTLEQAAKEREVVFEQGTRHAVCSCLKFEFEGIPCRHVLCVLRHEEIVDLPESYVLKRWTRHAKEGHAYDYQR